MKRILKKVFLLLIAGFGLACTSLILIMLNPGIAYAHQTQHGSITIYHQHELDVHFLPALDESLELIRQSYLYEEDLEIDFCLPEDSFYPRLVNGILGPARGISFLNKVVMTQALHYADNYSLFNHHRWNMTEVFAHELVHCYQVQEFGIPPIGRISWRLEGYAEYISRNSLSHIPLQERIDMYLDNKQKYPESNWIMYTDSMGSVMSYHQYLILTQYLLEVKGWSYRQMWEDQTPMQDIYEEMIEWHNNQSR